MNYRSRWGADHIKIDCIYMNRSPLISVEHRTSPLRPELAGGKAKAFFDRVKVRDLYDVANLRRVLDGRSMEERATAHKVILFYASLSATFPRGFENRPERFADRSRELEEQLLPMLRRDEEVPTIEGLIAAAHEFVSGYVLPKTDGEREYLIRFERGEFDPSLLFGDGPITRVAIASPEAQWKLQNIRKMQC